MPLKMRIKQVPKKMDKCTGLLVRNYKPKYMELPRLEIHQCSVIQTNLKKKRLFLQNQNIVETDEMFDIKGKTTTTL